MRIGDQVVAVVQVSEEGFSGAGVHVHAEPGELGQVVDAGDGLLMVRWERSGTACDCDASELGRPEGRAAPCARSAGACDTCDESALG